MLLEHPDIDVNSKDDAGRIPLYDAILVCDYDDDDTTEHHRNESMKLILGHANLDVNANIPLWQTDALHYATEHHCCEPLRLLLEH
ncbi:hypothetical protein K402DRAFT_347104, partial [Aulographum hederae CBS 113979]